MFSTRLEAQVKLTFPSARRVAFAATAKIRRIDAK